MSRETAEMTRRLAIRVEMSGLPVVNKEIPVHKKDCGKITLKLGHKFIVYPHGGVVFCGSNPELLRDIFQPDCLENSILNRAIEHAIQNKRNKLVKKLERLDNVLVNIGLQPSEMKRRDKHRLPSKDVRRKQ